jgi:hypothetical protein
LDESERVVGEGLEAHPDFAPGHVVAGRIFLDRGESGGAEEAFTKALARDPRNPEALRNLARILREKGETQRSIDLTRRLQEEEPWNEGLMSQLQAMEAAEGTGDPPSEDPEDPGEVAPDTESGGDLAWERATLQADESAEIAEEGLKAGTTGEEEGADRGPREPSIEGWEEEEADEPGDIPAWAAGDEVELSTEPGQGGLLVTRTLGEVYLRQGLLEKAEGVFRELLSRDPDDEEIRARLSEVEARVMAGVALPVVPIQDLSPEGIVPIGSLAPTPEVPPPSETPLLILPISALAPEEPLYPEVDLPWEVVPIEFLAPGGSGSSLPDGLGEVVLIETLAPAEVVSIESLAPDSPYSSDSPMRDSLDPEAGDPGEERRILEDFKDWLDNLP